MRRRTRDLACGALLAGAAFMGVAIAADGDAAEHVAVVTGGQALDAVWSQRPQVPRLADGGLVVEGGRTVLWAPIELGRDDFAAKFELLLPSLSGAGSGVRIDSSVLAIDGPGGEFHCAGPLFGGGSRPIAGSGGKVREGVPFEISVARSGEWIEFAANGELVMRAQVGTAPLGRIGIWGGRGAIAVGSFAVTGTGRRAADVHALWSAGGEVWDEVSLPSIAALPDGALLVSASAVRSDDQGKDVRRIVVRARDAGGHWGSSRAVGPEDLAGGDSSLIADSGAALLLVQAGAALKCMQSPDGGATWSVPRDVPLPWERSRLAGHGIRVPAEGGAVLCVPVTVPAVAQEGGSERSVALLRSADGGATWSSGAAPVEAVEAPALVGLGGGRLAMIGVRPKVDGCWMWMSDDAGATWGAPLKCAGLDPGTTRACAWRQADGALWLSESARRVPHALRRWRSDDGGATWSERLPVQLTPAGACAVAVAPDGVVWMAHEGGDFTRREHVLVRTVRDGR